MARRSQAEIRQQCTDDREKRKSTRLTLQGVMRGRSVDQAEDARAKALDALGEALKLVKEQESELASLRGQVANLEQTIVVLKAGLEISGDEGVGGRSTERAREGGKPPPSKLRQNPTSPIFENSAKNFSEAGDSARNSPAEAARIKAKAFNSDPVHCDYCKGPRSRCGHVAVNQPLPVICPYCHVPRTTCGHHSEAEWKDAFKAAIPEQPSWRKKGDPVPWRPEPQVFHTRSRRG